MTQRDKLRRADIMAMRLRGLAQKLREEAKDYDVKFPLRYARDIEVITEEYLQLK